MTYLNVVEVETAVANLAAAYPSLCQRIPLPNATVEGRSSSALRLGGGTLGSRDAVMIIGGVHAREWGSCEIIVDFAADLLEAYTGNFGLAYGGAAFTAPQIQSLLNNLHIVLFPLVNPDGRHYSQNTDAMWRRNRNPANSGGNPACIGVDINRNYDFMFDFVPLFSTSSAVSTYTSTNPCNANQVYHGPAAFSEAETRNVKYLLDMFPRTAWFIDVHSYSEDILYNWGDDENQTVNPAMNFHNPAFNGLRGVNLDTAYKEFITADDLAVTTTLAGNFRSAVQSVRGKNYMSMQSFHLYPTAGASDDYVYARHIVDPSKAKIYGYTIEWGTEFQPTWTEMEHIIEDVSAGLVEFCLSAPCAGGSTAVALDTPTLTFNSVPAGVTTSRAAKFEVQTCGALDLVVTAGPTVLSGPGTFSLPLGNSVHLPAASSAAERFQWIWVSFQGTTAGSTTTGTVTVHCPQTGQDYVVPIVAQTIAPPSVASVMVLDKSGSMNDASGIPGQLRMDVLHSAAPMYVSLLLDQDGVGLVSFDEDAHPVMPVTTAGALGSGAGRIGATSAIGLHATNPLGMTAIGDGVALAHSTLAPISTYGSKATVVFTDGEETAAQYIADVAGIINERVFAIGLGTVQEVNPIALNRLVNNTGGYLLLTDALGPNDIFRLSKYFVQISAGVTNADIVVDPDGLLVPGVEIRIPFDIAATDYGADAILLSPTPWAFEFVLETPAGTRIDPAMAGSVTGIQFHTDAGISLFRLGLPTFASGAAEHAGRWHVVLRIAANEWNQYLAVQRIRELAAAGSVLRGVPYSVSVHVRSSLHLTATLTQPSFEPGTVLNLRAVLTEIGLPVEGRATVRAEVTRPDATWTSVPLTETEPGVFEASTPAALSGVYPVRFRASGKSLHGTPFTREALRTGMAWAGGDGDPPRTDPTRSTQDWCDVARCLLADPGIQAWLKRLDIDPSRIVECACKG